MIINGKNTLMFPLLHDPRSRWTYEYHIHNTSRENCSDGN